MDADSKPDMFGSLAIAYDGEEGQNERGETKRRDEEEREKLLKLFF